MALYRPVAATADLPGAGAGRESGTYDFKGGVDPTPGAKRRELAKDVAAFANATGGVILVGAVEDKATGALEKYSGMKEEFAELVKAAYDAAVHDLCWPHPVVDAVRLKAPEPFEGYVVAVNVNAMVVSPVGVRWNDDPKNAAWSFPLRTTTHTTHLSPTELPMLMVPEVRRVMLLLDLIPPAERGDVQIFHNRHQALCPIPVTVKEIDHSTITVERFHPGGWVKSQLPIDRVTSVWRIEKNKWDVAMNGGIQIDAMGWLNFSP
jgi:hypothetical protein